MIPHLDGSLPIIILFQQNPMDHFDFHRSFMIGKYGQNNIMMEKIIGGQLMELILAQAVEQLLHWLEILGIGNNGLIE